MAYRQGTYNWLKRAGFLPYEARELAQTSKAGIHAPYFLRMVQTRRGLYLNALRYEWSNDHYRTVIKQQYLDRDAIDIDAIGRSRINVWKLLRWYEEHTQIPEEYESPWRKKGKRNRATKRQVKQTTRRAMLEDWIKQVDANIKKTENERYKARLLQQKATLEEQLRRLQ